jgi:hypothetical protein
MILSKELETKKAGAFMNSIFNNDRSAVMAAHAARLSLVAAAVIAIGLLLGFGAVDLYEQANNWVMLA